ncbi:MAG: outer membrane beta-barrel protein [Bacteroidetes bacterium]|nr:outer membrane beta-barrel protein [Bacteroidota bacterium]
MNLKRTIIVCLTCMFSILWASGAQAQDQRFRIGLKCSGNLSWIAPVTKNIKKDGSGLGLSYGLMGDYNFQKYYSLSAELLFTNISGGIQYTDLLKYTGTQGTQSYQNVHYNFHFKYLQLPVALKFKTREFGYITYWAQFGLAPSILMSATADIVDSRYPADWGDDASGIRVNKPEDDIYQFDNFNDKIFFMRLPLIIGGGIEYSISGNTSLYTGIRLDNNFLNIFQADKYTTAKNHYVGLHLGVFF